MCDMKTANKLHLKIIVAIFVPALLLTGCAKGGPTGNHSSTSSSSSSATSSSATPTQSSSSATSTNPSSSVTTGTNATTNTATGEMVDCKVKKCIALTYDDGPGPYTNELLDILKAENVRATFFVVGGKLAENAEILKREVAQGNVVGNHSWSHPDLTKISTSKAKDQLDRTSAQIEKITGTRPTLLRPPYGAFSKSKTPHQGMSFVLWNVDTEDWKNRNVKITTQRALAGAKRNSIILMHDIHYSSVKATPGIIKELKKQGFTLVTVPELYGGKMTAGQVYFGG